MYRRIGPLATKPTTGADAGGLVRTARVAGVVGSRRLVAVAVEAGGLHPLWRARIFAGEKVEQTARRLDDPDVMQRLAVAHGEHQLRRRAHAEPQDVGTRGVDRGDDVRFLLAPEVSAALADDLEVRIERAGAPRGFVDD